MAKKITELTALTTPSADDLLAIVDDPAGTPTTKKITFADLLNIPSGTFLKLLTDGPTGGLKLGATGDVNLYRIAAGTLSLGSRLQIGANGTGTVGLSFGTTDNSSMYLFENAGSNAYGFTYDTAGSSTNILANGTAVGKFTSAGQLKVPTAGSAGGLLIGGDTNLYRDSANTLATDDTFLIQGSAATTAFFTRQSGDADARFQVKVSGSLQWGSGAAASDTNLFRLAAGKLHTESVLVVGASGSTTSYLDLNLTAGAPSAADYIGNSRLIVTLASDTSLRFSVKGSDGTVRSGTLALA